MDKEEIVALMKELDEEYGSGDNIPDGAYEFLMGGDSEIGVTGGGKEYVRYDWRVVHGSYINRSVSDFPRWFANEESKNKGAQGATVRKLRGILGYSSPEQADAVATGYRKLRKAEDPLAANSALLGIAQAVTGLHVFVQLSTNGSFQNMQILKPDDKRVAAARDASAVAV